MRSTSWEKCQLGDFNLSDFLGTMFIPIHFYLLNATNEHDSLTDTQLTKKVRYTTGLALGRHFLSVKRKNNFESELMVTQKRIIKMEKTYV